MLEPLNVLDGPLIHGQNSVTKHAEEMKMYTVPFQWVLAIVFLESVDVFKVQTNWGFLNQNKRQNFDISIWLNQTWNLNSVENSVEPEILYKNRFGSVE